jgi:hypothetical protein
MGKLNLGKVLWNVFPEKVYSGDSHLWPTQHYYEEKAKANSSKVVVINTSVDIKTFNYHSGDTKPLKPYGGPDWAILINAHGNENTYTHNISGGGFKVNPLDLKKMLYMDGLSQDHKYIRLLSCYGGGLYSRPDTDSSCFAQVLAKVMGLKERIDGVSVSYPKILVGGYQGMVAAPEIKFPTGEAISDSNPFSSTMVSTHTGQWAPNRNPACLARTARYIVWFDAQGKWVSKDGSPDPKWGGEVDLAPLAADFPDLDLTDLMADFPDEESIPLTRSRNCCAIL